MIKVMTFGYGGWAYLAEELRSIIEDLGMELVTIHEHDNADIRWQRETWIEELKKADIIIIVSDWEKHNAKSNTRLTQALSLGKPVIASPLDAYKKVYEKHKKAFLIAEDLEQWRTFLAALRNSRKERDKMSEHALEASKEYSIDHIGNKWIDLFSNLEKVDIIIPTYNNVECLKLCLNSIRKCTKVIYNLIIVNNGTDEETHNYLECQGDIVYIKKENLNFSKAINEGIKASSSKYVCILNDDTIVSNNWLKTMVESCKDNVGAIGVLSNCDKGWLHNNDIKIKDIELLPGLNTLSQIEPIIEDIYNYQSKFNDVVEQDWTAFYCTLIPREVINKVGLLDEQFTNSGEDVDYCNRIRKQGYKIVQNYNSFVFHFGAVGRKILEKEDKEKYQKEQEITTSYLNEKWDKKNVVIYSGPSWERWDFKNLEKGGIGGSETWQIQLAREFDKLGYRVKVFLDCAESGIKDGNVEYLHYNQFPSYTEQNWIDYFISSRTTDSLDIPVRSEKNYVMIHDIWLLSDKNKLHLDKVDKFCVLSDWHKEFAGNYHGIPEDKLWITANGIDFDRFKKKVKRKPNRLIYSSSADRGLDTLLYLFDFIKEEIPDLELHIFYGFDTWEKSILQRNNKNEIDFMKKLKKDMKKEGVFYHGRVDQEKLAKEFLKSSLLAYPTDFEETFCITAIEAQKAGVPIISSNYAGLKTTIGDSAMLLGNGEKGQSYTKEYRDEFVTKCISILKNQDEWNEWSKKGLENVKKYSWKNVASNWSSQFKSSK